jgi:exodeoxyribonuclease V alpha subunit
MIPPPRDPPPWLPTLADALDEALPRLLGAPSDPRIGELITALTFALERGELELDLTGPPPPGVDASHWPEGHRRALRASPLARDPQGPLAREGERLLWRRWQRRRQEVLEALLRRTAPLPEAGPADRPPRLPAALDARQREAVRAVLRQRLVLLEGGPGTGKTSTVAAMLDAVSSRDPAARIHLAAPTGKAAARLRATTGDRWPCGTLHRLLESRGDHFGRNRRRPLGLDLLVLDEVSMVDLALMEALLEALPPSCRLVLVGDPAQLPPVAPGPLLIELQRPGVRRDLGEAVITLVTPYRNQGLIAAVAADLRQAIEAGTAGEAPDLLGLIQPHLEAAPSPADLELRHASALLPPAMALERLERHQRRLGGLAERWREQPDTWPELLAARDRLLVLAPIRHGPWGLKALHEALLGAAAAAVDDWPAGTPVLCTRNLPALGLANGDLGVLVRPAGEGREAWLLFGDPGGAEPGLVHPAQLAGALEAALALTVHKAQGSEAEEVVLLLPAAERQDPRLLYTALTRARRRVLLLTPLPEGGGPVSADEG